MALSEQILCISVILILNTSWSQSASISRPFLNDLYPPSPSEVLQVKPVLVFPRARNLKYFKSNEEPQESDKVIYVKLTKKSYRPRHLKPFEGFEAPPSKDFAPSNDIFYVKALANGQFSDHRLKLFRIPEFYSINVFKKNDVV